MSSPLVMEPEKCHGMQLRGNEAIEAVAKLQQHVVQLRPLRVGLRVHHTSAVSLRTVRSDIRDFAAVV